MHEHKHREPPHSPRDPLRKIGVMLTHVHAMMLSQETKMARIDDELATLTTNVASLTAVVSRAVDKINAGGSGVGVTDAEIQAIVDAHTAVAAQTTALDMALANAPIVNPAP